MRVLVTGGAGYLGSVLVRKLLGRGHAVRVVDVGYFGLDHLRSMGAEVEVVREDIRRCREDQDFTQDLLRGCATVVHLAAISNDPSAELNPALTEEVNFRATCALAQAAREVGARFLFSSSCSVYGEADGDLDEDGQLRPLTTYATSKVKAEETLLAMANADWSPVILRNGTLFGYSPRMRFDLVANIFALHATLYEEIKIFGAGTQWRPFLHVSDCARAFIHFVELASPRHHIYNVAHRNLRVVDLAQIYCELRPGLRVVQLDMDDEDRRDYRVSSQRLQAEGFRTRIDVDLGAEEMIEAIASRQIPDPESVYYRNAKWIKELTQLGSMEHRQIVTFIETLAQVRAASHA